MHIWRAKFKHFLMGMIIFCVTFPAEFWARFSMKVSQVFKLYIKKLVCFSKTPSLFGWSASSACKTIYSAIELKLSSVPEKAVAPAESMLFIRCCSTGDESD